MVRDGRRVEHLVERTPDFVLWLDQRGVVIDRNPAADALASVVDIVPDVAISVAGARGSWTGELQVLLRDGRIVDTSAVVVADGDAYGVTMHDISALKAQEAVLRRMAERDSLTGLWNRYVLLTHLEQAVAGAGRGVVSAVLYLDVDQLKQVNDSGGHAAGDRYLQEFAAELERAVRADDVVARMGGDEFAVLMRGVPVGDLEGVAHAVRDRLSGLALSASIGAAPVDGSQRSDDVIVQADRACYAAKAAGGNCVELFRAS
ncbi:MAG: GGDEF domain-containing protein [Actinobacteria bacterium]|nr:GGDEF domain-containing protein [Actinomycetota bacterium]